MHSTPNLTTTKTSGAANGSSIFFSQRPMHMNHVNLIGRVAGEPRFYENKDGRRVAQLTLTTVEHYLDEEGNTKQKSHWHRIAAWGRWVKVVEELVCEGTELAVEGKLLTRFFFRDGQRQFISEVEVNDLVII